MNEPTDPLSARTRWRRMRPAVRWGLAMVWLGWTACAVATLLIVFSDVESVLATGPIIAIVGMAAILAGWLGKHVPTVLLGVSNCAICLLFWLLVLTLGWGPGDAHVPFAVMGFFYTAGTCPLAIRAALRAPTDVDPWVCAQCAYLLYGLSEPRCPECGTPFDPSLLGRGPETRGERSPPEG